MQVLGQVGDEVQLASGAGARVAEVTDDWITIDANHELAGRTLHYDVELLGLTKVPFRRSPCQIVRRVGRDMRHHARTQRCAR